jgi:predicted regulator of Ras-like GTPase activity (Roadblock/LC7/MglB family)
MLLQDVLKPLQDVNGYLAAAIIGMNGEVLAQHNNSKFQIDKIGANEVTLVNAAVKSVMNAGLGKCNFVQVNSDKGIFGAVWAVEDKAIAAVLLEPNGNVGMAKLLLAKVGEEAGSKLA